MLVPVCDRHPEDMARAKTKSFGIDGQALVIDLCRPCEEQMLDAIAEFVEAARTSNGAHRVNGRPTRAPKPPTPTSTERDQPEPAVEHPRANLSSSDMTKEQRGEVRAWARENGYDVGPRGSIAQKIIDHYFASV
jgi:hypothetical protein